MHDATDINRMRVALEEAQAAARREEVPIGAVLVERESGEIVARAGNRTLELCDPSAHAEMQVIRQVCRETGVQRLPGYDLYVTIEPCPMCASVISFARIGRVVFGAADPKSGGLTTPVRLYEQAQLHHKPVITGGVLAEECGQLMSAFFARKRS